MKNVLILGAGQSAPYLINYLLNEAEKNDWYVTVCDRDKELAARRINSHPRGKAVEFDVNDENMRNDQIKNADIVVNFLAPVFQYLIASDCLKYGKHVVTASYENSRVAELNQEAISKGVIILNEMGLDPGIDHMSAMKIIQNIKDRNGIITSFISYGTSLPAPDVDFNNLKYCITWNPKNVALAGEAGAQYMEDNKIKIVGHNQLFNRTWKVEVDGIGTLEAYPNRDSLIYRKIFDLEKVTTMIRGTLRYPGYSEIWLQIVRLGIPNDIMKIPELADKTYREFTEMFVPVNTNGAKLETRVANHLGINPTGKIIDNLIWLGLFDDKKIGGTVKTAADVLTKLLIEKLPLPDGARDMVALIHEIEAEFPKENNKKEKTTSTFVEYGEPNGFTAISKTVGLPAAIATKLILKDELPLTGCHIPTHPVIYTRLLKEMEEIGFKFKEKVEVVK
ncbi:MAG: saccharopine dehydrogenase [Ignavibacteriae bacterium HGW-Ignavibacteriae-2]|jgi:saccharopine dehydrogenase-like NADP-dependent oxidoreductase|nr:MAG: saccharopine dehydrogenase [Ignavibacteriae bacterium HGW-Ignavibacteriae-2]